MNLTKILEATVSPDQNELQQAQTYLEQAAQENLPQFIVALVNELADGGKSQVARMAAGLQLKNALTSKDPTIRMQHQQRWLTLDEQVKQHVKQRVIQTLGTETARPAIAPQCIAAIACAEFPIGQWLEVIDDLYNMVIASRSTEALKEQALQTIGYICEDVDPNHILFGESRLILTAIIVEGNRRPNIKLRAANALLSSLEILEQHFKGKADCKLIMEFVFEAIQSNETKLRVVALQNLAKIVSLYYEHMDDYMDEALSISISAIRSNCDQVSQQGMEFWSSVCGQEIYLQGWQQEFKRAESNFESWPINRFYARGASQQLTPFLINCIQRQEEFDDEDGWSPRQAANVCLRLLAVCCLDVVHPPNILPFAIQAL
ncbi:PREDICTED: importin subunit beta-1-like isoform X1 [Acropora digitifera]|uniref:importin subunit beta-1-like isoform X1 n=1 Tax=Acropora digitifera TaxID=70779 RepID=UPI00077AA060|nr:PREDICTED: importin subunit beta-1-like isoform X1 [Acropora digitifera]XP_015763608.1 PREDICTED: importin subunit beta-1-like isoform X1 [Acropora digitifera]